jgi:hypothetical protein
MKPTKPRADFGDSASSKVSKQFLNPDGTKRDAAVIVTGNMAPTKLPTFEEVMALFENESTRPTRAFNQAARRDFAELLQICMLDESDRQPNGDYAFKKGTVSVLVREQKTGNNVHLKIGTTRGAKPVQGNFLFTTEEDGTLTLRGAHAHHENEQYDDQVIVNAEMLTFALNKAHEEIRLVKQPEWWLAQIQSYDDAHNTNYTQQYIDKNLGGVDPRKPKQNPPAQCPFHTKPK